MREGIWWSSASTNRSGLSGSLPDVLVATVTAVEEEAVANDAGAEAALVAFAVEGAIEVDCAVTEVVVEAKREEEDDEEDFLLGLDSIDFELVLLDA